jgi:lysophospholipase L1-like esterase
MPSKKYIATQLLIVMGIFCLMEAFVRYQGYTPGDLRPNWSNFHPVDTLIVYDDFIVDSSGILVANKNFFKTSIALNSNGFRAPEFNSLDTAKHKLLLIGDSFTWGLTAHPLDSCFADLLASKTDATIINTGIPSADPAQYEAIAKKYIPILQPEKVVVMFFLGNDIMQQERPIIPYQPFYYYTNAGAMMADDDSIHLSSAKEAYKYYTNQKFFLLHPSGFWETIISKSALLSRFYSMKYRWQEKQAALKAIADMPVTKAHLFNIIKVCKEYHCALQIILIPERKEADMQMPFFVKRYSQLFNDSILARYIYIPEDNSPKNYTPYPDGHLNNQGHAFYADKIAEQIHKMNK